MCWSGWRALWRRQCDDGRGDTHCDDVPALQVLGPWRRGILALLAVHAEMSLWFGVMCFFGGMLAGSTAVVGIMLWDDVRRTYR